MKTIPGAWQRSTARERKMQERRLECRIPSPPKPHTGPCFLPVYENVKQDDGSIKRELKGHQQTRACTMAGGWHPGRGLSAQEIDNLLMQNYPVHSPEARRRSRKILEHRRRLRPMNPTDYQAALARIEAAG